MPTWMQVITKQLFGNVDPTFGLILFFLIFLRVLLIMNLVPFLGAKHTPGTLRMGLSITLSILLWPFVLLQSPTPLPSSLITIIFLGFKEITVGFLFGFLISLIFQIAEISGQLMDTFRGVNQIQLMAPGMQDRSSALGTLNFQLFVCLFVLLDLHSIFFQALQKSFITIPIFGWPNATFSHSILLERFIPLFSDFFWISFALSLPVLIVSFIIEIGFGFLNRIAPQINAFFLAIPAKALGGIGIFFAALSLMIEQNIYFAKKILSTISHLLSGFWVF